MADIKEAIRRLIYKFETEGAENLKAALEGIASSTEKNERAALSLEKQFKAQERKFNPMLRQQQDYRKELEKAHNAFAQMPQLQTRYENVLVGINRHYEKIGAAAQMAALQQKRAAEVAVSRQTIIPDRAADIAAVGRQLESLRDKFVPLNVAQREYRQSLDELRGPVARAAMSEKERADAIQLTKGAFVQQVRSIQEADRHTRASTTGQRLARHEMINLSRQIQDVGVSLASGQSPFMVLVQQGAQIADIAATSGVSIGAMFKQAAVGAARFIGPVGGAIAGVAALGVAGVTSAMNFTTGQKEIRLSLLGVGQASRVTADDINSIAKKTSSTFGFSVSEAQEFASALAATGRVGVEEIGKVTALGKDVARIYGIDAADAAKKLAAAYTEPAQGAEELNKRLGSFSAATLENIRHLQTQNKLQEAQALLTEGLDKGVKGVNSTVGTATNLWTALGNAISNAWRAFGEGAAKAMGLAEESPVAILNKQLKEAEARIAQIQDRLANMPASSQRGQPGTRARADLAAEEAKLREINERLKANTQELERQGEVTRRNQESVANLKMVDTAFPLAKQLADAQALAKGLSDLLKDIAASGGEASQKLADMGRSLQSVQTAAAAAREQVAALKDAVAQQERQLQVAEELRALYPGISLEIAKQAEAMRDQLAVAQAVTEQEKIKAQEIATANALRREGRSAEEQALIGSQQTATAQAAINTQHARTMVQLQGQLSIAQANVTTKEIEAQHQATINSLMAQGSTLAQATRAADSQRLFARQQEAQYQATITNLVMQGYSVEQATAQAATQRATAQAQVNTQHQQTMNSLQGQLQLAQVVGGAEKIRVQEQLNINAGLQQGLSLLQAQEQAAMKRKISEAEVTSQAQETLAGMRDQYAVAAAVNGIDKIKARAQATYNRLLREGVDEATAAAIAAQQEKNERAAATAAVENQTIALRQQTELIKARRNGTEATVAAEIAYAEAVRSGADEWAARELAKATYENVKAREEASKPKIKGYRSVWETEVGIAIAKGFLRVTENAFTEHYGTGALAAELTSQGFEQRVDQLLSRGGSIASVLGQLFNRLQFRGIGTPEFLQDQASMAEKLIDLFPKEQQAAEIEKLISRVRQQPISLAREELIKSLTDKLEGLKDSVDALNGALSPYYSQDPRTTTLGFRAGTKGMADWLLPGASNKTALDTILGKGATAPGGITKAVADAIVPKLNNLPVTPGITGSQITPYTEEQLRYRREHGITTHGMAAGGSFVVGGGYSATDNRMARFPVASGEQVVVNRRPQDQRPVVVHNDNRIIIQGAVDQDTLSKMKISRYQQTQRIRGAMSAA